MGRTLPSITQAYMQETCGFTRFRRALRRADQLALDCLFAAARQHLSRGRLRGATPYPWKPFAFHAAGGTQGNAATAPRAGRAARGVECLT